MQAVQVRGDRLIMLEREAGAQQSRLVVRSLADPTGGAIVLADPAAGAADAASAVDWFYASPHGELVAFGVSEGGTESSVLRVVRTTDGSLLTDEIPNCRACSVGWEPDGTGFYYTRYPEGDEYHRTVHHHVLGDDWHDDPVVWNDFPTIPRRGRTCTCRPRAGYVLVDAMVGWGRTDLHVLDRQCGQWRTLISGVEVQNEYFTFRDELTLIGVTSLEAPRRRVVSIDLRGDDVGTGGVAHASWPRATTCWGRSSRCPVASTSSRPGSASTASGSSPMTARCATIDGPEMRSVPGIAVDREVGHGGGDRERLRRAAVDVAARHRRQRQRVCIPRSIGRSCPILR